MELTLGLTGVAILALALFLGCTVYSATGFGIAMTAHAYHAACRRRPADGGCGGEHRGSERGDSDSDSGAKGYSVQGDCANCGSGRVGSAVWRSDIEFADPTIIRIGIAVLILALAAMSLKEFQGEIPFSGILGVVAGFIVGACLTAFAVGGPLIVLFLLARNLRRQSVRGAMAFFLLVIAAIGSVSYAFTGLYSVERLTLVAIALVPSFIGFGLGALLIQRMNERIFRYVVLGIIGLSSMAVLLPEIMKLV